VARVTIRTCDHKLAHGGIAPAGLTISALRRLDDFPRDRRADCHSCQI
jgi:hypothetical protein